MARVAFADWVLVAGTAAAVICSAGMVIAAVENEPPRRLAEVVASPERLLNGAADLQVRFVQEDGPESGHVRAVLTPELRPITILEARAAAQQAFLQALKQPGLGDKLSRITVVVRLMPETHPVLDTAEEVFLFLHKGGRTWSITAGD
jgi:hypothetical protein